MFSGDVQFRLDRKNAFDVFGWYDAKDPQCRVIKLCLLRDFQHNQKWNIIVNNVLYYIEATYLSRRTGLDA